MAGPMMHSKSPLCHPILFYFTLSFHPASCLQHAILYFNEDIIYIYIYLFIYIYIYIYIIYIYIYIYEGHNTTLKVKTRLDSRSSDKGLYIFCISN